MPVQQYVALLRGINVGGRNKVPMAELRSVFAGNGYADVRTYIQSGNVVFATSAERNGLETALEDMLESELGLSVPVVVRSHRQLRNVVRNAPDGFGSEPAVYHSDVVFLKVPLTSQRAAGVITLREGVDRVWPGSGVLYFQRLSKRRSQSRLARITQIPEYALMTIRNWNTSTRLLEIMDTRTD